MTLLDSLTALRRRHRAAVAAAVLATGALALQPPASQAGTYRHQSLGFAGATNVDGWTSAIDPVGGYHATAVLLDRAVASWNVGGGQSAYAPGQYTSFKYTAPLGTTVDHVYWVSRIRSLVSGPWASAVTSSTHDLDAEAPAVNGMFPHNVDGSGTFLEFVLRCAGPATCFAATDAAYQIDTVRVSLNDAHHPALAGAATGELVSRSKLTGVVSVTYPATDAGSGILRTRILDGDDVVASRDLASTGHCVDLTGDRDFDRQVPCPLSATPTAYLDTTTLDDGPHSLTVEVEDAAGNTTPVYGPATKVVANHPPVNTARPALSAQADIALFSAPKIGAGITFPNGGTWSGPGLTYTYAWVRCNADGGGCAQIPNATSLTYAPTSDDVGRRIKLAVTATNAADSVTVYSDPSGVVALPKSESDLVLKPAPPAPVVAPPALVSTSTTTTTNTIERELHTFVGRVAGEQPGVACPGDKATLKFEHVAGGRLELRHGASGFAQVLLTCTTNGKAITGAKLDVATKTGARAAIASDVTTDGGGHATLRLAKGASRGITVGYRMYADDPLARATASLKVVVKSKVIIKADRRRLRNGRAVTLRGSLAGGEVPRRGVALAVQWKDGKRWRPFAQIKTNKNGKFTYAYRFTRTSRSVSYQLRVQISKGQVDYPYLATASKPVKVTVAP